MIMESQLVERHASSGEKKSAKAEREAEERSRIERYNEILLTSSSILAGFAMTGLLGLPEVGSEGIQRLGATLHLEPHPLAFTIVYYSTLLATICFLGVLVAIISVRLQGRIPRMRSLRSSFRSSVLVFGLGLAALFCATIGIPTMNGFIVGLAGGAAITLSLLFRALVLQ